MTKAADFIIPDDWDLTVCTVKILDKAMDKRRFAAFGGDLKKIHHALNLGDPEDGDLVHIDDESKAEKEGNEIIFHWYTGYRQYYAEV